MNKLKSILLLIILFICSVNVHSQFATGYEPMDEGEYDKLEITFSSTFKSKKVPISYTIPEEYFPVPRSQGQMGSCVGWATGYAFASFYFSAKNKTGKPENSSQIMSPAFVYHDVRKCNECNCGSSVQGALELLRTKGVVPWVNMPYSDNTCYRPDQSLYNVASNYRISGWQRVVDKMNFREYKEHLSNDVPIIIGVQLGSNFGSYGWKKTANSFTCTQLEANSGHAMLIVGFDDDKRAFKIMNSWGSNWGVNGYIWVDYDCFKLMMGSYGGEAYVVNKDYTLNGDDKPVITPDNNTISASNFEPYGHWELVKTGHYYIDYGIKINQNLQNQVEKVTYVFDHSSFANKYVTITSAPFFQTSFEGPHCLSNMSAIVYLKDGRSTTVHFNGCEVIKKVETNINTLDIQPVVTAVPNKNQQGYYTFNIQLRGIESVKSKIVKVVYDFNHSSFKNRYQTISNGINNFQTSYNGWGCLRGLGVTIYFDNNTSKTYNVDMCSLLGW